MSDTDDTIDWRFTTYEGTRREQMRRAARLPFDRILDAIEEMGDLAAELAAQSATGRTAKPAPPPHEPSAVGARPPQCAEASGQPTIALAVRPPEPVMTHLDFDECFNALTAHHPMRWQARLYSRMASGRLPTAIDLPTGLGKTSVIPIWLIALASQNGDGAPPLPRRLVYIVNRRTVVDQATDVVARMRERLRNPRDDDWSEHEETLDVLCHRLRALSASGEEDAPLGVSTLRGELADNEEWKADPTRPAIIVGTIDMIGSKLLFSGYGDGRYHRAHHAGLIGQDALIVHDEAHLTPAFGDLLRGVVREQRQAGEPRLVQVMELSATRRDGDDGANVLRLESEDEKDEKDTIVVDRLDASKCLRLHMVGETNVVSTLVKHATAHDSASSKVLIYTRSPESAQKIVKELKKELGANTDDRVALLTGTIRGHERAELLQKDPVYKALLDHGSKTEQTVYLVSTSAGEVGIDLDADHMVCDLTTLDAMIQRLGRVNRGGGQGREARVDVVVETDRSKDGVNGSDFQEAIAATLATLQRWTKEAGCEVDASPRNLRRLVEALSNDERAAGFSSKPTVPPLTDILLDAWSLTSIDKMAGRPEVAAYLHGLTHDPPETYVVWRKEVATLDEFHIDEPALSDWFRACRIEGRERLRDRTDRVKKALHRLLKAHRKKDPECDFRVVLLDERGEAERSSLSKIVDKSFNNLAYRTIVLPIEAAGLDEHGMLDPKAVEPIDDIDVAEEAAGNDRRERWLLDGERRERLLTVADADSLSANLRERARIILKEPSEDAENEDEASVLVLMVTPRESAVESPETARFRQTLDDHTALIVDHMKRIADRIGLERSIGEALVSAAEWHDRGKDRPVWQGYACNPNVGEPLAKSERYSHWHILSGYRHEFGSVLEAMMDDGLRDHPERDLILHLIAAHHGHARPHFDRRAFDNNERFSTELNEQAAADVMRRFGRLEQRFGRWGLAWLESLLRCADIAASTQPLKIKRRRRQRSRSRRHEDF